MVCFKMNFVCENESILTFCSVDMAGLICPYHDNSQAYVNKQGNTTNLINSFFHRK